MAIVATGRQLELVCDLSSGAISNELEWLSDLAQVQWHEASRGLSATAELLVLAPTIASEQFVHGCRNVVMFGNIATVYRETATVIAAKVSG